MSANPQQQLQNQQQQSLKGEVTRILSANVGNRLTEELVLGFTVTIGALLEPIMRELEQLRSAQKGNGNG